MKKRYILLLIFLLVLLPVIGVNILSIEEKRPPDVAVGEVDQRFGRRIYESCYLQGDKLFIDINFSTEISGFGLLEFPLTYGTEKGYETLFHTPLDPNKFMIALLLTGARPGDGSKFFLSITDGEEIIPLVDLVRKRSDDSHPKRLVLLFNRPISEKELKYGVKTTELISVFPGSWSFLTPQEDHGNPYQDTGGLYVDPKDIPTTLLTKPKLWKLLIQKSER